MGAEKLLFAKKSDERDDLDGLACVVLAFGLE